MIVFALFWPNCQVLTTNGILFLAYRKGLSQSALPYRRSVPTVSTHSLYFAKAKWLLHIFWTRVLYFNTVPHFCSGWSSHLMMSKSRSSSWPRRVWLLPRLVSASLGFLPCNMQMLRLITWHDYNNWRSPQFSSQLLADSDIAEQFKNVWLHITCARCPSRYLADHDVDTIMLNFCSNF